MTSSTTGLTQLMSTYYDKVFLERAKAAQVFAQGAVTKKMKANSGKVVYWNRMSPLALATTALTEAQNSNVADMTATIVSATVAEYGNYTLVSSLFDMTSIDADLKEHVDIHGQNAGESLDKLINNELSANATIQLAGAKANITAADNLRAGQIGKIAGVEFLESNNSSTQASTVTVYHTFIFGKNAYGVVDLEGQPGSRILVKTPGVNSTNDPLNMVSTIGWKAFFATKVLNSDWVIVIKSGATA